MFAPVFQVNVQVTISLVTICIGAEVVMRLVPRSFDVLAALLTPVFYREPAAALCGGFAALHWTLHPAPGHSHHRRTSVLYL